MGDVRNTSDENQRILHNIADNQSPTRRERPLIGGSSEVRFRLFGVGLDVLGSTFVVYMFISSIL